MTAGTAVDVRHIDGADLPQWVRAWNTGYLRPGAGDDDIEFLSDSLAGDRLIGAFDKDLCVGTYRSSAQELTVPGGASLPAAAISKVSVAATHRRRGLLGRMTEQDLRDTADREVPLVVLDAAQYPLYGRFGFGPATSMAWYEIDVHRAGIDPAWASAAPGVQLVDAAAYAKLAPQAYERFRTTQAGALRRDDTWWQEATGQRISPGSSWTEPFYAVHEDPAGGGIDGLLCFTAEETWQSMLPRTPLYVRDLVAATPQAERALFRYAVTADWVSTVHLPYRAPDTLLPQWLGNPRAARITALSDYMWLRILDVPRALAARGYAAEGALVLQVDDAAGHAQGRWLLEAGPDGADCARSARPADLQLDVRDLARLYLGEETAVRLGQLGLAQELRPGGLARADALLRTARRPWSPRAATGNAALQARPC
ncbi:GNAT family N-acetyltransferase [Streptomyces sp. NPDC021093]|uniref:GNAT family N-acetyltransferase n=1 Tax=Streptomyces sp. NPDC021093 TaxID=3365112 RepID=UPI003789C578